MPLRAKAGRLPEDQKETNTMIETDSFGPIRVLILDNPPVNAVSPGVPRALMAALREAEADSGVAGILLAAGGKGGFAGADIRFQGGAWPEGVPKLSDLITVLDGAAKPTLALVRGNALGGGLEMAMACHFRAATPGTKLCQPEVNLGIPPGAGGTQRLPRLVGVEKALDMIVGGRPIPAEAGRDCGLIDLIVPEADNPIEAAASWFAERLKADALPPPVSRRVVPEFSAGIFDEARASAAKRSRGQSAPLICIDCVEAATRLPFPEGAAFERERFHKAVGSSQAAALRHVFAAERAARKVPGLDPARAVLVARVGIVGAGTMGTGIAMACANAGLDVMVSDRSEVMLDRARTRVSETYAGQARKGRIDDADAGRRRDRIGFGVGAEVLSGCDLVIEAAFEDMDVKRAIFADLARLTKRGTVLATNTSYLDIDRIAEAAGDRRADVVGLHFFSPANIMPLLEVVRAEATSDAALATAVETGKRLRKKAIVARVCPGFIANRSFEKYTREAEFLLQEGATPEQVDAALVAFGMPMGPFAVRDLAGLDIGWARRKSVAHERDPALRYSRVGDLICERGWFGQKTGKGFYAYDEGSRNRRPNPDVAEIIRQTAAEDGIAQRQITDAEIVERCFYQVVNEAARILDEGIALRASDIDLAWIAGYGFPRWRGGVLHWAEGLGLDAVLERVRQFDASHDYWTPAPLLERLAEAGESFATVAAEKFS